jgi:hypothetical protein
VGIVDQINRDIAEATERNEWCLLRWGKSYEQCTERERAEANRLRTTPIGGGFVPDARCACGEDGCAHFDCGYPWCRPCKEHHRPPECAVNERGESLAPCGCTWAETEVPGYYDQPCRHAAQYD